MVYFASTVHVLLITNSYTLHTCYTLYCTCYIRFGLCVFTFPLVSTNCFSMKLVPNKKS